MQKSIPKAARLVRLPRLWGEPVRLWPLLVGLAIVLFPIDWLSEVWSPFGRVFDLVFVNARDHFIGHATMFFLMSLIVLLAIPALRFRPRALAACPDSVEGTETPGPPSPHSHSLRSFARPYLRPARYFGLMLLVGVGQEALQSLFKQEVTLWSLRDLLVYDLTGITLAYLVVFAWYRLFLNRKPQPASQEDQ